MNALRRAGGSSASGHDFAMAMNALPAPVR